MFVALFLPILLFIPQIDASTAIWQKAQAHLAQANGLSFQVKTTVEILEDKAWLVASTTRGTMKFTQDLTGQFSVVQTRHPISGEADDFRLQGGCDGKQIWLADASSKVCQSMRATPSSLLHLLGGFRICKKWLNIPELFPLGAFEKHRSHNGTYTLSQSTHWGEESYSFSADDQITGMTRTTLEGRIRTIMTLSIVGLFDADSCKDWSSTAPASYTQMGDPK